MYLPQGEAAGGTQDSCLWCLSHHLPGLLSDGHYNCTSNDDHLKGIYRHRMSHVDARRLSNMQFHHHGEPGMVGSLDCMHIGWYLCPVALQGQYEGKEKNNIPYSRGSG